MTLKAFKAALKPGLQIEVTEHWIEKLRGTTRTVEAVQGNGYWFRAPDGQRMWAPHPKAAQLTSYMEGGRYHARITFAEGKGWTLRFPPGTG